MSSDARIRVVLCWHMHQPPYRDPERGTYRLPWTYLHAIKDYVDMAAHLEAVPEARAVVNLTPVLLEQIADYAAAIRAHLRDGSALPDPVLEALAGTPAGSEAETRTRIHACTRAHERNLIDRFPAFRRLVDMARSIEAQPELAGYLDEQLLADLATWYHLAWLGETVRDDERVQRLQEQSGGFGRRQRRELLELVGELLDGLLDRYRRLAAAGRVELSTTPYAHPLAPLLLDFEAARETVPDAPLPRGDAYPGGVERLRGHVRAGLEVFERHLGFRPRGLWPAEGAVSDGVLKLLEEEGLAWTASGEGVLAHSLGAGYARYGAPASGRLCQPYRLAGGALPCFFRDDQLSDRIGFVYADWHADDAVGDLLHRLEEVADRVGDPEAGPVVPIVLDGENAWEHYPHNGYRFLRGLHRRLAEHPRLEMSTFADVVDAGVPTGELPHVVPGSWVYGTLSTWIGEAEKNRGWEALVEAKHAFDAAVSGGVLDDAQRAMAERQLALCEGSDWCWWLGDASPAGVVDDFEALYRRHLAALYRILGAEPPEELAHALAHGGGSGEDVGAMRRGWSGD